LASSWARWLLDAPGEAFGPGSRDARLSALLELGLAINVVIDYERLYLHVRALQATLAREVPATEVACGWSPAVIADVSAALEDLAENLASGQGLSKDDIEHWHDRLTTCGARWVDGFGHPWGQGEGLGTPGPALVSAEEAELRAQLASTRFWAEQEGELWRSLGRVVRGLGAYAAPRAE
jgi:hypothetical protein